MRRFDYLVLGVVALLVSHAVGAQEPTAPVAEVSAEARLQYDKARDSVAQIRVLLGSSNSHSSTGTGFLVGDGLFLTNYHVVADKALEPDVYQLEFVLPGGSRGPLTIVAVDVVHDLAVVKGKAAGRALPFRDSAPEKGDKGYSLGYPLSQGLTVVEGTYNGRSEEQYYERIHFTGAINAGMSGGPVLDSRGRVFGINVATHQYGQLVTFLVPQKFAKALLARAAKNPARGPDFQRVVGAQLNAHEADMMGTLLKRPLPVQDLGEFSVPARIGDFMQCGAGTQREPNRLYTADNYHCYTLSSLYIDSRLHTGMVSFQHAIIRNIGLGPLSFAHLQETRFASKNYGASFDRRHHTRFECNDDIVALNGVKAKMAMCVRRYKQFPGLYDMVLKIATLGGSGLALHSALNMQGVSFEAASELSRRYLEAIRWSR